MASQVRAEPGGQEIYEENQRHMGQNAKEKESLRKRNAQSKKDRTHSRVHRHPPVDPERWSALVQVQRVRVERCETSTPR
jgi:hypothetical protein